MSIMKNAIMVLSVALLAASALCGCRLRDERTVVISTPGIRNEACFNRARSEIAKLKGVSKLEFNSEAGTLTVVYDSMQLGLKNLEHAICDAGFDANELKAPAEAVQALPAECLIGK